MPTVDECRTSVAVPLVWTLLCLATYAITQDLGGSRFRPEEARTEKLQQVWKNQPLIAGPDSTADEFDDSGALVLEADDQVELTWLFKSIPVEGPGLLKIEAVIEGSELPALELGDRGARFVAVGRDHENRERYELPHVLAQAEDADEATRFKAFFDVGEDIRFMKVGLMNFATRGTITANEIELSWVTPHRSTPALIALLQLVWAILAGRQLQSVLAQRHPPRVRALTVGALACLVSFALVPRDLVGNFATQATETLRSSIEPGPGDGLYAVAAAPQLFAQSSSLGTTRPGDEAAPEHHDPAPLKVGSTDQESKSAPPPPWYSPWDIGHLVGFFVLTTLLIRGGSQHRAEAFLRVLSIGISIEVLQFFTADRTPSTSDVLVDALGCLTAIFLVRPAVRPDSDRDRPAPGKSMKQPATTSKPAIQAASSQR